MKLIIYKTRRQNPLTFVSTSTFRFWQPIFHSTMCWWL